MAETMYSATQELFSYYHLDFNIYYLSIVLFAFNTLKIAKYEKTAKKSVSVYCDFLCGAVILFGVISGLIFQGAVMDIIPNYTTWFVRLAVIAAVDFSLFLIQLFLVLKKGRR